MYDNVKMQEVCIDLFSLPFLPLPFHLLFLYSPAKNKARALFLERGRDAVMFFRKGDDVCVDAVPREERIL